VKKRVLLVAGCGALWLCVSRCHAVYDVTLELDDAAAGRGFGCVDDAGPLITQRLQANAVNIVMDVIDLGTDVLSCRPTTIADYCANHPCFVRQRACYTVDLSSATPETAVTDAYEQLKAEDAGLSGIPTDRTVMIRFVATAETTCDPNKPLDGSKVGGCVYSCPAKLDASGKIDLDLDEPAFVDCVLAVEACATFPATN
jgi:hypothetical protein